MNGKSIDTQVTETDAKEALKPRRPTVAKPHLAGAEDRKAQLIDAAERIFLEKGYHAARMDDIAKIAGMSKKTIYQIFPSKEGLFEALVAARHAAFTPCRYDPSLSLEDILCEMVFDCTEWCLAPDRLALLRLIMGEYSRSPELGRIVERQGQMRGVTALEKCLTALGATGRYAIEDTREMARMLLGMAVGNIHMERLLGCGQPISKPAIRRRVERSVGIFLQGIRKPHP